MKRQFLLTGCLLAFSLLSPLFGATYTVTNTNDSGAGSLRQAMLDADATSAADLIVFNISGQAPHTISIGSGTGISLPQMNTSGGQLIIDGSTQPANGYTGNSPKIILDGTSVTSGSDQDGLNLWGNNSEVLGLQIQNFPHNGIACAADNALIGRPGNGNVIINNSWHGVYIFIITPNVTVQGNWIGTDMGGTANLGNGDDGVHFWQFSDNGLVGGTGAGEGNVIAYNDNGVNVRSGNYNTISRNSIYCNTSKGIKLDPFSPGNQGYAAPVITAGNTAGASGTAQPNAIVELFRDDNCNNCEGKDYLGTVTANAAGNWTYAGSLSGTITATATDPSTGNSSEFSSCFLISAGSPPVTDFSVSQTTICAGECVDFTDLSSGTPNTWSWSFSGAATSNSSLQNPVGICYPAPGNFEVSLTTTNPFGTDSLTRTAYITVNAPPSAFAGPDILICADHPVTLNASGGDTYLWTPGGQTTASISLNPTQTETWSVTVTDTATGCTNTDSLLITVKPRPAVTISGDTSACLGDFVTLAASGADNYNWTPGAQTSASISVAPGGTTTFSVIGTDAFNGCTDTASHTINIFPTPTPNLGNDTVICPTCTLSLDADPTGQWSGASFLWQDGSTNSTFDVTSTGTYIVSITTGDGCTGSDTIFVDAEGNSRSSTPGFLWTVHPQPADNWVTFTASGPMLQNRGLVVQVYDLQGREVLPKQKSLDSSLSLDVSKLSGGVYLYEIYPEGSLEMWQRGKIVIQ